MAQTIKLKRSASQGAVPSISDLDLGEVAINTYDGKMYIKKDDGTSPQTIVEISGTGGVAGGDFTFSDNEKAIFGDGSDLQIYHDASHSYIVDAGTGNMYISTNGNGIVMQASLSETMFAALPNGAVRLYHANAEKLTTTATGVDVTGSVTADGLTSQIATAGGRSTLATFQNSAGVAAGNQATIELKNGGQIAFITAESTQGNSGVDLIFSSNNSSATETDKIRIAEDGDISFYDSAGTTAKLFWDASAESLGIGTDSPGEALEVVGKVEADEFLGSLRGAILFNAQADEALVAGDVVYISGISGNTTTVAKADADDAAKMPAFGLALAAANLNSAVEIVTFGTLSNIDTSAFSEGDELFVSTTAGGLVNSAPTGESAQIQKMAKVTRSDASVGSVKVMGAGRSNATPNLNTGRLFVGDANNQTVADDTIYVDIANSRVGIGTSSPAYLMHLEDSNGADLALSNSTVSPSAGDYLGRIYALDSTNNFFAGINMFYHDDNDGEMRFRVKTNGTNADVMTLVDGNVGIGTDSPESGLHLFDGTNVRAPQNANRKATLTIEAGSEASADIQMLNASYNHIFFGDAADANVGYFLYDHTNNSMQFATNASERMRIDSNGNVGIGETSIGSNALEIRRSGASGIVLKETGVAQFYVEQDTDAKIRVTNSKNLIFSGGTDGITERMRLDANGNLLVGKTSTGAATAGIELNGVNDLLRIARDGGVLQELNRIGTGGTENGDLIEFRVNNVAVGSIGVHTSDVVGVSLRGNASYGGIGLPNDRNTIWPINSSSAPTNNVMDIGSSSVRFKDLYLSGTVNTGTISSGDITTTGVLHGPSTFYIDPSPDDTGSPGGAVTDTGTVVILGDLQVTGTTTTIDSTTLQVSDLNITVAKEATNAAEANGAGLTVAGANATLTYGSTADAWSFNKNVGIGTSPSFPLHVSGSSTNYVMSETTGTGTSSGFRLKGDASADFTLFTTQGTNQFAIYDNANSAERMRIDSSGNVGIGVDAPAQRLDVREEKTGGGVLIQVFNTDNANTTTQTAGIALGPDSRGSTARIIAVKENADFSTNAGRDIALTFSSVLNNTPTERMRIDASGNVGIGTDPQSFSKFQVKATTDQHVSVFTNASGLTIGGLTDTGGSGALRIAGAPLHLTGQGGGAGSGPDIAIISSGDVGIGTADPDANLQIGDFTGSRKLLLAGANSASDSSQIIFADASTQPSPFYAGMGIRYNSNTNQLIIESHFDTGVSPNNTTQPIVTFDREDQSATFVGTIYTRGAGSLTPDATQPGAIILAKGGSEASPETEGRGIEFLTADVNDGYGHRLVSFDNSGGDTPLILQRRNNNAAWTTQVTFEGNSNNATFAGAISASNLSGTNTGDEPAASTTVAGIVELASITETNAGVSGTRAVTPAGLNGWTGSSNVTTLGTIATGTWNGSVIASAYLDSDTAHLSGTQNFTGNKTFSGGLVVSASSPSFVINDSDATNATDQVGFISFQRGSVEKAWIGYGSSGNSNFTIKNTEGAVTIESNADVIGTLTATSKSFDIEHPTKEGMRLRYGSLEGPENGVYVRGRMDGEQVIELPDYWLGLVHEDTITVSLTAIGPGSVWVESIENNVITVGGSEKFFYHVFAERKDIEKLTVEYDV